MASTAASWPATVLPRTGAFWLENQSRSGGISILGNEQVVASPSARWRARFGGPVVTQASVLAWRAFVASMGGRAGTVLVPKSEAYGPRDANGRRFNEQSTALYGDDGLFLDGTNFDLTGFSQDDGSVYASAADAAPVNATQIAIDYAPGIDGIRPGQYFGIDGRLYLAHRVWQVDANAPTQIQFAPWLRSALSQGDAIIIDRPVCLMRFAQDQTGELDLDMGRWGRGGLEFVEAW